MVFARLSDKSVEDNRDWLPGRKKRPSAPATPYAAIERFQEGGEIGFGEPEGGYEDDFSYEEDRNVWDDNEQVWYDPVYGNTYDPYGDQLWHSPEGLVYQGGVWGEPQQLGPEFPEANFLSEAYQSLLGQVQEGRIDPYLANQQWSTLTGQTAAAQRDAEAALRAAETGDYQGMNLREQLQFQRQGETPYGEIPGRLLGAGLNVGRSALESALEGLGYLLEPSFQGAGVLGRNVPIPDILAGYAGSGYTGREPGSFVSLGEVLGTAPPWSE